MSECDATPDPSVRRPTSPGPGAPSIRIAGQDYAADAGLPMAARLLEAGALVEDRGDVDCWDPDEPCDSGGSCGECVVEVLSGAANLSPRQPRERHTIAALNRKRFGGRLDEGRCRLSCQVYCRGPVEVAKVAQMPQVTQVAQVAAPERTRDPDVDEGVVVRALIVMFQRALCDAVRRELHGCARRLADALGLGPALADAAVPEFCAGDEVLTEFFQVVELLRRSPRQEQVAALPDFQRIEAVMASPLFGAVAGPADPAPATAQREPLLRRPADALDRALAATRQAARARAGGEDAAWSLDELARAARSAAEADDDLSLVSFAARVGEPELMLLARAQSAASRTLDGDPEDDVVWEVDAAFAARAGAFVDLANALLGADLPAPVVAHASHYFWASQGIGPSGQCVALGPGVGEDTCYWAFGPSDRATGRRKPEPEQFFDVEAWDSARYGEQVLPFAWQERHSPERRRWARRREPCACGSGRRYENCHGLEEDA